MHLCSSGSCTSLWRFHGDDDVLLFASLSILRPRHLSAVAVNFKKYPQAIDQVVFKPIQWLLIRSFFLHSSTVFRISIKFLLIDLV